MIREYAKSRVLQGFTGLILAFFILSGCQTNTDGGISSAVIDSDSASTGNLIELNVIDEEDVNKDTYITVYEVLDVIRKITGSDSYGMIDDWYLKDYRGSRRSLASLDYLDDECKLLILGLHTAHVLTFDDTFSIGLYKNATYFETLTFISRMIGDTYGCTDYPEEYDLTEKSEIFNAAYEKGLVNSIDTQNADLPILRKDFYKIIYKAINVNRQIGGVAPTEGTYVDSLRGRVTKTPVSKEPILTKTNEISMEYTINNDLSISWTLPLEYRFLGTGDNFIWFSIITEDETEVGIFGSSFRYYTEGLDAGSIIKALIRTYPKTPKYLRGTCTEYYEDNTSEEWYFNIDIQEIKVIVEGDAVEPGTFTRFIGQWVPETITLANGQKFRTNVYYLITSYDNSYRKPEYNSTSIAFFQAKRDTDIINNSSKDINLNGGCLYLGEMHLQEMIISGDADSGFILSVTPESEGIFTVKEGSAPKY